MEEIMNVIRYFVSSVAYITKNVPVGLHYTLICAFANS